MVIKVDSEYTVKTEKQRGRKSVLLFLAKDIIFETASEYSYLINPFVHFFQME